MRYLVLIVIGCTLAVLSYRLVRRRRNQQLWGRLDVAYLGALALYLVLGASFVFDLYHGHEPVVPRTIWAEH